MKLTKKEIALLSDRERALLASNGPWQVKPLVQTIQRVRALRDRAADLRQRQTIANRQGRGGKRVAAPNVRSDDKLAVLEKALAHLRLALEAIDAESTRAIADLRSAERASASRRPAAAGSAAGKKSKASATAVKAPSRKVAAARSAATNKDVSKPGKVAAAKVAKAKGAIAKAAPTKAVRAKAPVKAISGKARQPLVRALPGAGAAPPGGGASRRTRAKKSRKG